MKMKNIRLLIVLFTFFYVACDIIEEPYMIKQDKPVVVIDTSSTDTTDTIIIVQPVRKVLIEDFTGHRCGNCPRSHEKLQELKELYGEQIVPLSVHVGFFAWPLGSYTADYRTPMGDEISTYFGNADALPNGMVNRSSITGEQVMSYTSWASAVDQILELDAEINIDITNSYDTTSRELTVEVEAKALTDISQTLKLVVLLSEDSIVSMQTDYDHTPQDIADYTHRHVLRGAINSTWGDLLANGSFVTDETATRIYSFTISNDFNYKQCSVVAYIYDNETLEIIQAEEQKVVKE